MEIPYSLKREFVPIISVTNLDLFLVDSSEIRT
jgi:hypothetical protein